jgi:nucleotide-binding universal stress UspA family protein
MSYKDALAIVASVEDRHVLSCTEQVASQFGLTVTFAAIGWRPEPPGFSEAWPLGDMTDVELRKENERLDAIKKQIAPCLERLDKTASLETHLLDPQDARQSVGRRARFVDLVVVSRPAERVLGDVHTPLIEGALLESDRPVLVVPPNWRRAALGRRIVICWNASREATRALADAAPFLDAAESVCVLTASESASPDAASDLLCEHLRRHCADTSMHRLDPGASTDALALLEAAAGRNADLIVMGGYGRTRLSEIMFGGVTREMLAGAQLPILMAH